MTSDLSGTYTNGSISASLSGLTAGTTYYYKAYVTVQGTGDFASESKTFEGAAQSFQTKDAPVTKLASWLDGYEIPASSTATLSASDVLYQGKYSHSTVNETYGSTKAAVYNTVNTTQTIVVHTFESTTSNVVPSYSMLFDKSKACALWVAYSFDKTDHTDKNVGRNEAWDYDPAIPQDWQPNLSSTYKKDSQNNAYSRGHQCASNDRQTTVSENKQTFYYSNMTPQNQLLNGGTWAALESYVQGKGTACSANQQLYVVTGPIFAAGYKTTKDNSNKDCAIPTGYYKCIMLCTFDSTGTMTDAKGVGFTFAHDGTNAPRETTSIDDVEALTGFDFFANVPDALENAAEAMTSSF